MKLIIGADLVVTPSNEKYFEEGSVENIIDTNIKNRLDNADFRIINLETPVSDVREPILKCGPNIIASEKSINGIKGLNPSLLLLANNHILDHGDKAIRKTFDLLCENNIDFIGAGENLKEASKPYIIYGEEGKIGIYNCCEHEFTIAGEESYGANPFDPLESLDHISTLKEKCDFVIVFYHGGKEHYRYPSPNLQKICRKIADKGADLVICQHSHCVGCFEDYNGSKIIYGQGNFIFAKNTGIESWNTSLIVEADIKGNRAKYNYLPVCMTETGIRMAEGREAEEILSGFSSRSEEIKEKGFVKKVYDSFCENIINNYINVMAGHDWLEEGYTHTPDLLGTYKEHIATAIYNYFYCEAHNEVILNALKNKINYNENK